MKGPTTIVITRGQGKVHTYVQYMCTSEQSVWGMILAEVGHRSDYPISTKLKPLSCACGSEQGLIYKENHSKHRSRDSHRSAGRCDRYRSTIDYRSINDQS